MTGERHGEGQLHNSAFFSERLCRRNRLLCSKQTTWMLPPRNARGSEEMHPAGYGDSILANCRHSLTNVRGHALFGELNNNNALLDGSAG